MRGLLLLFFLPLSAGAAVSWDAFLDTYYAYDFNSPETRRRFTTQPVRHNEPNINLAFAGVKLEQENVRGRIALQGGNSVEANTAGFETSDIRYIQEAYAGVKLGETWVDAGIYLGHIGAESWISRDNWIYTRALNLDYVPYYAAGVRITRGNFQFHLMNGWQTVRENNEAKAVGIQFARGPFVYNNFFGDEEVVSQRSRFRGYHNFILKSENVIAAFDVGHQARQEESGTDIWMAASLTVRKKLTGDRAIAGRIEHYHDPHEANVITGTRGGFVTSSVSAGFDQKLPRNILWRNEVRGFSSRDPVFPEGNRGKNRLDGFFVTSLSISLP